jgi:hypothetical protein
MAIFVIVVSAVILAVLNHAWEWFSDDGPRVKVRAVIDQDAITFDDKPAGATYLIPKARADITPPPEGAETSCAGRYKWATSQDGTVANIVNLRVTLTPRDSQTLALDGVGVVPVKRNEPRAGVVATCAGGGSTNPEDPSTLEVGLQRTGATTKKFVKPDGSPADFVFHLEHEEPVTFDVSAEAKDCDCSFYLKVHGTQDGEPVTINVRDADGKPFRVTSTQRGDLASYNPDTREWQLAPTGSAPTPTANVPAARTSACAHLNIKELARAAGVTLKRGGPAGTRFNAGVGAAGEDIASSVCNWSAGPADDMGNIPTFAVQHVVAGNEASAQREYAATKHGMTANGHGVPWTSETIAGHKVDVQDTANPTVLVRVGRSVLALTGTSGVDLDLLRAAAAQLLAAVHG